MFSLGNAAVLGIVIGFVWFWYVSLAARERAMDVVRNVCAELRLQALDQTVALASIRPFRSDSGHVALRRVYRFEFSTAGNDRCPAWLGFEGAALKWVRLEHPNGPIHLDV